MSLHPDQLRCLVQDCIAKHLYSTAVFYADKLVTMTEYAPGDVYLLAQVHQKPILAFEAFSTHKQPCLQTYTQRHAVSLACQPA
jgi:hypothetical protein